jgi:hypothetical protein
MKEYKLHNGLSQQFVIDVERNIFIPFDDANTDFAEYKKWLAEGNTPEPAEEQT